jgi:hypothetical protein
VQVRVEHIFGSQANDMGGTLVRTISLVLSRFHAAPSARLGHLAFESHGAFPAEG